MSSEIKPEVRIGIDTEKATFNLMYGSVMVMEGIPTQIMAEAYKKTFESIIERT